MSLIRLLTSGKSWVKVKDAANRYQMGDPRAMPKFGSGRNPFRGSGKSVECRVSSVVSAKADECRGVTVQEQPDPVAAVSSVEAAKGTEFRRTTVVGAADGAKTAFSVGRKIRASSRRLLRVVESALERAALGAKLNSLLRPRPKKPAKPAVPRFTKSTVQGELSLDRIKVMRNDSSEPDMEPEQREAKAMGTDDERVKGPLSPTLPPSAGGREKAGREKKPMLEIAGMEKG